VLCFRCTQYLQPNVQRLQVRDVALCRWWLVNYCSARMLPRARPAIRWPATVECLRRRLNNATALLSVTSHCRIWISPWRCSSLTIDRMAVKARPTRWGLHPHPIARRQWIEGFLLVIISGFLALFCRGNTDLSIVTFASDLLTANCMGWTNTGNLSGKFWDFLFPTLTKRQRNDVLCEFIARVDCDSDVTLLLQYN